jgi:hypothetical protein
VYSMRFTRFALLASSLILLSACAGGKITMPSEYCSPMRGDKLVCNVKTYGFPDAGGFMCFRPEEIEPFLERYGER